MVKIGTEKSGFLNCVIYAYWHLT